MTDIDPRAEIQIHSHGDHVTVRIPLTDPVNKVWYRRYETLAQARQLPAVVDQHGGQAWIRLTVPTGTEPTGLLTMMDAARDLIAEVATAEPPPAAVTEAVIRDWWSRQRA